MVRTWHFGDDFAPLRELLDAGGVLAIPTESSYGLAVDPFNPVGVEAIYALKRREARKPLPLVIANVDQAQALGLDTESDAYRFGARFWPAPLTMLVPLTRPSAASRGALALGDLEFVAVRIPDYEPLVELLEGVGHGLTATSANVSGTPPLLTSEAVTRLLATLGNGETRDTLSEKRSAGRRLAEEEPLSEKPSPPVAVVVTAALAGGAPSTVVAWQRGEPVILRQGKFVVPARG